MIFDQLVVFITVIFTVVALFRGFIREFLGIVGLSFSCVSTYYFTEITANTFLYKLSSPVIAQLVAGIGIFVVSLIVMSIVNGVLLNLFKNMRHSIVDSLLGGVLGFAKGYFVCFVLYIAVYMSVPILHPDITPEDEYDPMLPIWLKRSRTYTIFYQTKNYLDDLIKIETISQNGAQILDKPQ